MWTLINYFVSDDLSALSSRSFEASYNLRLEKFLEFLKSHFRFIFHFASDQNMQEQQRKNSEQATAGIDKAAPAPTP